MMKIVSRFLLVCCALVPLAACKKSATTQPTKAEQAVSPAPTSAEASPSGRDACTLITSAEVEAVQGAPVKETKPSARSGNGVTVTQCYYLVETESKSVSLSLTQSMSGDPANKSPKDFWQRTFHRDEKKAGESER